MSKNIFDEVTDLEKRIRKSHPGLRGVVVAFKFPAGSSLVVTLGETKGLGNRIRKTLQSDRGESRDRG